MREFSVVLFIFSAVSFSAAFCLEGDPAAVIPRTKYSFQNQFLVTQLRRSEVVDSSTKEGAARLKELRKDQFQCLHQSPVSYLCTKFEASPRLSETQESYVKSSFLNSQLDFSKPLLSVVPVDSGSEQSDFFVSQQVKVSLNSNREASDFLIYEKYGLTLMNDGRIFLKLPGDSEKPNVILKRISPLRLAMTMILQTEAQSLPVRRLAQKQTLGYFIDIYFDQMTDGNIF